MRTEQAEHQLTNIELREFFQYIAARDDVAQGKPHPDVYLKATAMLSMDPKDSLALEDSFNFSSLPKKSAVNVSAPLRICTL